MKRNPLIFGALWLATVVLAFIAGSSRPPGDSPGTTSGDGSASPARPERSQASAPASRSSMLRKEAGTPASRIVNSLAPTEAVTELARMSNAIERSRGILALIDRLEPDEFQAVVDEFRSLGITNQRFAEYRLLLTAWAKVNPEEALTYARENTGGDFARNTILATWAQEDLTTAVAWASQNHEGEGANPWMVGIIEGVVEFDPAMAAQLTTELPYSRERGSALEAVVGKLVAADPDEAMKWANSLEDERLQVGAIASVATEIARQAPAEAAAWVASIENTEAQQRAAEDVGERLADHDMEEAMAWAESMPAAARGQALEGVVDRLVNQDPVRAAEWLAGFEDPEINLDGAIGELVRGSVEKDPFLAATWVAGIRDERNRVRYYHRIIGDWMQRDAPAATDFIQTNQVPESIQRRFLQNQDQ